MIELIKAIIEPIAKSLSLTDLIEAKKKKKAHEIGTELFLLYASLNEILVSGRHIVEELQTAVSWMNRKLNEGQPDACYSGSIAFLLNQQSQSIVKLVESIKRLGLEFQVIAPDVYLKLIPLIHGKLHAVSQLLDAISGGWGKPKLVSMDFDRIKHLMDHSATTALSMEADNLEDRVKFTMDSEDRAGENFSHLFVNEPIDNVNSIPAKQCPIIRNYLERRKPTVALDDIESALRIFAKH